MNFGMNTPGLLSLKTWSRGTFSALLLIAMIAFTVTTAVAAPPNSQDDQQLKARVESSAQAATTYFANNEQDRQAMANAVHANDLGAIKSLLLKAGFKSDDLSKLDVQPHDTPPDHGKKYKTIIVTLEITWPRKITVTITYTY